MAVKHIVLLKFKPETKAEVISDFFADLSALESGIPEMLSYEHGPYSSNEGLNQDFTHGFVMTFSSETARDHYLTHPKHLDIATGVQQHLVQFPSGVIAFDFCS